jgi:hypothetical protein
VDLLMPRGARGDRNKTKLVEGLKVLNADGGRLALNHCRMHIFEGTMPDGRKNSVELRIATIPSFLAMNGYALAGRDKKKDAYDIYYSVRHYKGGIAALTTECLSLLEEDEARTGFAHIAGKSRDRDDFGPATVRQFLEESDALGEMTPDQVQTDSYMRVSTLLEALGIVK